MSRSEGGPGQGPTDVRYASLDDSAAIAAIHVDSFLATYPHYPTTRRSTETSLAGRMALWDSRVRAPAAGQFTLVARHEGRLGGFIYCGPTTDSDDNGRTVGQILSVHVSPALVGRGVGRRLMAEALAALGAAGYRTASLWVVADNHRARRFYERLGWRHDGAVRQEALAVSGEEGDEVEVVRYCLDLPPDSEMGDAGTWGSLTHWQGRIDLDFFGLLAVWCGFQWF